jgi:hypothetical protein
MTGQFPDKMEQVETYAPKNSLWFFCNCLFSPFFIGCSFDYFKGYVLFSMQYSSRKFNSRPLNIGGLTISEAMEEIKTLSSIPLELKYRESLIQVNPEQFSFKN